MKPLLLLIILPLLFSQSLWFKAKPTKDEVKELKKELNKKWHIINFKFKGIEV